MDKKLELKSRIDRSALDVRMFAWEGILPCKARKNKNVRRQSQRTQKELDVNTQHFIHWVLGILQLYVPKVPRKKKWNALAIYMNEKNINYLYGQMDSMIWLDIGPTCCQELADDEYGVDPKNILTDL